MRVKRRNQYLHFLDEDGMVACNPRDPEAAHRAQMDGIATQNTQAVTCEKCRVATGRAGDKRRPRVAE